MGINDTDYYSDNGTVVTVYNTMPNNINIAIQKKQLIDSKTGWLKKKKKEKKGENISIVTKRMIFVW